MFHSALAECGYPNAKRAVRTARLSTNDAQVRAQRIDAARTAILKSAKRCGKGRFAQIASKYANEATALPKYIRAAIEWLLED